MEFNDVLLDTHEIMAEFQDLSQLPEIIEDYGSKNFTVMYRGGECPYKFLIPNTEIKTQDNVIEQWQIFLTDVQELNDPLLNSVLRMGFRPTLDKNTNYLMVQFPPKVETFGTWVADCRTEWYPVLHKVFKNNKIQLMMCFGDARE